jgi:hypothetical protein
VDLAALVVAAIAAVAAAAPPVAEPPAMDAGARAGHVAASWAERQLGKHEIGETKCGRRVNAWVRGMGYRLPPCRPWCGAFVHAAYLRAGVRLSRRLISAEPTYDDVLAGRHHLRRIPVRAVRRGDIVLFDYVPRRRATHFGIVTRPFDAAGRVRTVEGNVGDSVVRKTHRAGVIVLAARVVP